MFIDELDEVKEGRDESIDGSFRNVELREEFAVQTGSAILRADKQGIFLNSDSFNSATYKIPWMGDTARIYNSSNQSISHNTWTSLMFNSEDFDPQELHDTSSNTSRITIQKAGRYIIAASAAFDANSTGRRIIRSYKNGTTNLAVHSTNALGAGEHDLSISTIASLAVGDYVEVQVFQNCGVALNVLAGNDRTHLSLQRSS